MFSPYRVSIRRNVVKLNRKYHAKVTALPFALCKDEAIWKIKNVVSSARDEALAGSLMAKYLPFRSGSLRPNDVKAVYVPVWFIDGEIEGNVIRSGAEVSAKVYPLNACMPGFSYSPLSNFSFSQRGFEEHAIPFTPELRHQHDVDVSCIPFSISPIPFPEIVRSLTPSQTELSNSVTLDPKSVDFEMLAAYPVLLPIYLIRYDFQIPETLETKSLTCVVRAHSKDVWTNVFSGTIEISGLLPETSGVAPSSPVYQFSHAVDDAPETGIWCSPSSITTPALASSLGWFYEAVMDWLEEKVKSKSNIDALAKYGANMDHPCVRMFTKEEVDANRNFLWVSASIWTKLEPLKKASPEGLQSGAVRVQMRGEDVDDPEAVLASLKELALAAKDKHRPQWVRDFRDSQKRGQFAPP